MLSQLFSIIVYVDRGDKMDYFNFMKKIKNRELPPVIFLHGEGSYFIHKIRKELEKQILQDDYENLSVYDLQETPLEEVVNDAETYPFFGDEKLIIAENPSFLLARPPKLRIEHKLDSLERYISAPVEYSTLLIIAPYPSIDNRKKITQLLTKKTLSMKFDHIQEREQRKWIEEFMKIYNLNLDRDLILYLEEKLGTNLQMMENEFEKLSLYAGEDGRIGREEIDSLLAQTIDSSSFSLIDAVISKNSQQAFSIYKDLLRMNESSIGLIALFAQQFRTILQVKLLKQKGYNEYQIQQQIGGHPYSIKLASRRERSFSKDRLIYIINRLAETDQVIKTGQAEEMIAVEMLLFDLIHK